MFKHKILICGFLLSLFFNFSFVFAGTITGTNKYAWSNNYGYINFENLIVNDLSLSGYAWSENAGWIKFNPALGGVSNDGDGHLSGFAWGENLGWIDFGGVSISTTTGIFSGTATGTVVGTITFDCPNYCIVETDWRPTSPVCTSFTYSNWGSCSGTTQTRTVISSSPSGCIGGNPVVSQGCVNGSGGGSYGSIPLFPHINSINQNLIILPGQSGTYVKDTDAGQVVLQMNKGSVAEEIVVNVVDEKISSNNKNLVSFDTKLINDVFYDITAKDINGNPVHVFAFPLTITLPVPTNLIGENNLGVYWLNETNGQWILIPDAVFSNNKVVFQINHLTKFAIFKIISTPVNINVIKIPTTIKNPQPSLSAPSLSTSTPTTTTNTEISKNIAKTTQYPIENNNTLFFVLLLLFIVIFTYNAHNKK